MSASAFLKGCVSHSWWVLAHLLRTREFSDGVLLVSGWHHPVDGRTFASGPLVLQAVSVGETPTQRLVTFFCGCD